MTNRKTIKITIPADSVDAFSEAKERAEQAAMLKMTDTQYASRLLQWAVDMNSTARARIEVSQLGDGNIIASPHGTLGTVAFASSIEIMRAWEDTLLPEYEDE